MMRFTTCCGIEHFVMAITKPCCELVMEAGSPSRTPAKAESDATAERDGVFS